MDQYLYIPFLGGWTSIYQLFWCELQGDRVLTHPQLFLWFFGERYMNEANLKNLNKPRRDLPRTHGWKVPALCRTQRRNLDGDQGYYPFARTPNVADISKLFGEYPIPNTGILASISSHFTADSCYSSQMIMVSKLVAGQIFCISIPTS